MMTVRSGSNNLILIFWTLTMIDRKCLRLRYEVQDIIKHLFRVSYQVNSHIIEYLKFEVLFNIQLTSVETSVSLLTIDLLLTSNGTWTLLNLDGNITWGCAQPFDDSLIWKCGSLWNESNWCFCSCAFFARYCYGIREWNTLKFQYLIWIVTKAPRFECTPYFISV